MDRSARLRRRSPLAQEQPLELATMAPVPDASPFGPTTAAQPAPTQQTNRVPSFNLSQISINPPDQVAGPSSDAALQRQTDTDQERPTVGPEGGTLDQSLGKRIDAARGGGAALDTSARTSMEPLFAHDFSNVRVYQDSESDQLSRALGATAFTTGNDIFFRDGAYRPSSQRGQQLIAHELTHVVQQEGVTPASGTALTVGSVDDVAEIEAEQAAEAVTADMQDGQIERTSTRPSSVSRSIQRAPDAAPAPTATQTAPTTAPTTTPAPTTASPLPATVTAASVEQLGAGLQARQTHLGNFLSQAQTDISNIRGYFKWVNDVYERCYEHYDLVLKQAKKQADTQQAWMDFISGVITGLAIGVIFDAIPALAVAKGLLKAASEVGSGAVSGGIGAATKTDAPALAPPIELNPAFKKVVALQQLDQLNSEVLALAVPGTMVYTNPLLQIERLKAELRVSAAGGQRQLSDDEMQKMYADLVTFDGKSVQFDESLKQAELKFDALRAAYMGKQAPTDQRCEQDIWIPWIAKQNPGEAAFWSVGPVLGMTILQNHFVDIGLAAKGTRGGRLNAAVGGDVADAQYDPEAHTIVTVDSSAELVLGAKAEQAQLAPYWANVFLMTAGGGQGQQGGQ